MKINKEQHFSVPTDKFMIEGTASGYTVMYGDGTNFKAWSQATPANEVTLIVNAPKFSYFYLSGNTADNVKITF